jgi:hypothetical protein
VDGTRNVCEHENSAQGLMGLASMREGCWRGHWITVADETVELDLLSTTLHDITQISHVRLIQLLWYTTPSETKITLNTMSAHWIQWIHTDQRHPESAFKYSPIILPEPSASRSFLKLPHCSTDWECSESVFNWAGGRSNWYTCHAGCHAVVWNCSSPYLNIPCY